jgi:dTDP-4-amino-4,6-dideoxygalactose transaminase
VTALEAALAQRAEVEHCFTCASGTLAVETALRAVGVGPGTEVILGAYDYEPSFLCIHALGATPVLVDVHSDHACLQASAVAQAITPHTKAILATHLHGVRAAMNAVRAVAAPHGIAIIEDAAQMPGMPLLGDLGVLSFGGSKLLTAGRGGAVLVRASALAQKVKLALHRGIQQWAPLSELQAAVLLPQWHALPERAQQRRERVQQLATMLADVPGLRMFARDPAGDYYKVGFYFDEAAFGLARAMFVKALQAEGIAFDVGFRALQVGRAPSRYKASAPLPNAEMAGHAVVVLHHPVLALTLADLEQVAVAVQKTYRNATHLR